MKLKNLVGDRFKERPADCVIDSHAFTIRAAISNMLPTASIPCILL